MSLSSYNGHSNFTIKGKKFIKRGANNIYDIASVAGTSGNFSTGWVQTDGATTVANGATLTFDHNLGTTDLVVHIYVSSSADGSNPQDFQRGHATGSSNAYGGGVTNITENILEIQLSSNGYLDLNSSGQVTTTSFSGKYIKVVASVGGGMARASGMIVAAQATNNNRVWNLGHGFNVASMSSVFNHSTGNRSTESVVHTITLETPLFNPIPILSHQGMSTFQDITVRMYNTITNTNAVLELNSLTNYQNQEFDTLQIKHENYYPFWSSFAIL